MGALAELEELRESSEARAEVHLERLLSELQRDVSGLQDTFLDIEGDAVALFKLAVIETQKVDDVQAIAEAWRLMANGYARSLERSEEAGQRIEKGRQTYERLEMTAVLPPHFDHLIRCLKRLQARCLELYALHA